MNTLDLSEIKSIPGNNRCADCGLINPDWASISFGTLFCLECSGVHRSLGVHISFVRSLVMDSWSPKQISIMKAGGNSKCQAYLASKGIPANALIKDKYGSEDAQNYKEVLKARVEGRSEPKIFQKKAGFMMKKEILSERINNGNNAIKNLEPVTNQKSFVPHTYSKNKSPQILNFFSEDNVRGKIQGIGSSNPYQNNASTELGYIKESISLGLGSAWKAMENITAKAQSILSKDGNIRELTGKVKSTGMGFWKTVKTLTEKTAVILVEPKDESRCCELQERAQTEENKLNSSRTIYEGIGYDSLDRNSYLNSKSNSNITGSLTEETHSGSNDERSIKTNRKKFFKANDGRNHNAGVSNLLNFTSVQDRIPQNNMVSENISNDDFFSKFNT